MKRGFAIGVIFLAIFFSISVILMSYINFFYDPEIQEETPTPTMNDVFQENDTEESVERISTVVLGEDSAEPSYISIMSGEVVTWKNNGSSRRRFWIDEETYSDLIEPGESYSYTFYECGEHTFRDVFNGNIKGKIQVIEGSKITGNLFKGVPEIYRDIIGLQIMALSIGLLFILSEHQSEI